MSLEEKSKKSKIPVITRKIVGGASFIGFIIFVTAVSISFVHHNMQFENQFNTDMEEIATAAAKVLNPDTFDKYLETKEKDESYYHVERILKSFVKTFNLNLIYVSKVEAPDYTDITYIYNVTADDYPTIGFDLGHSERYVEKEYNNSMARIFGNGESLVRHAYSERSGNHITANVPIYNSEGKIVAVLGAQESIDRFSRSRRTYFIVMLILGTMIAAIFVIVFSSYFNFAFIRPISVLTRETDHFASYGGKPSSKLLEIQNNDEIGILAHSIYQMEYDVCKNIEELTVVTAEKERISTELNVAAKIQSDMLPKGYPAFPDRKDFDLYATMHSAKEVGGDLYDYCLLGDDRLMMVVGDVSGKGVPAALFMSKCKTLISLLSTFNLSPKEIMEETNNQLCRGNETGLFVTCWLGIITLSTGELKFVNAGHPYPVIYQNKEFAYLETKPNFVLGGMENVKYTEHTVKLSKDSRLLVYSDGVSEATDSKDDFFGEERLLEALQDTENFSARETVETVQMRIDEFVGNAPQFDDITMLAFDFALSSVLSIDAKVEKLDDVINFIHSRLNRLNNIEINEKFLMQLDLIVEELFVNIESYA